VKSIDYVINAEKIVRKAFLQVLSSGENLGCGVAFTLLRCIRTTLNSLGESTPKLSRVDFERILHYKEFKLYNYLRYFLVKVTEGSTIVVKMLTK
jgi:hypothetical protein